MSEIVLPRGYVGFAEGFERARATWRAVYIETTAAGQDTPVEADIRDRMHRWMDYRSEARRRMQEILGGGLLVCTFVAANGGRVPVKAGAWVSLWPEHDYLTQPSPRGPIRGRLAFEAQALEAAIQQEANRIRAENVDFIDANWNLDQALTWIATRRADLVNQASDDPFVRQRGRGGWMILLASLAEDDEALPPEYRSLPLVSREEAERGLLRAIKRGKVRTTKLAAGQPVEIAPATYSHADYHRGLERVFLVDLGDTRAPVPCRVNIADVLSLWPDPSEIGRRWPTPTQDTAPQSSSAGGSVAAPPLAAGNDEPSVIATHHVKVERVLSDELGHGRDRQPDAPAPRTGAPGRPTSIHIVLDEFEKRIADGRVVQGVTEEARALEERFAEFRKGQQGLRPLRWKTIRNNIGARYRALGLGPQKARN